MKAPPDPFLTLPLPELVAYCRWVMENQPFMALSPKQAVVFMRMVLWPSMSLSLLRNWTKSRKKAFKLVNVNRCRTDENKRNQCRPRYLVRDLVDMCKLRTVREEAA